VQVLYDGVANVLSPLTGGSPPSSGDLLQIGGAVLPGLAGPPNVPPPPLAAAVPALPTLATPMLQSGVTAPTASTPVLALPVVPRQSPPPPGGGTPSGAAPPAAATPAANGAGPLRTDLTAVSRGDSPPSGAPSTRSEPPPSNAVTSPFDVRALTALSYATAWGTITPAALAPGVERPDGSSPHMPQGPPAPRLPALASGVASAALFFGLLAALTVLLAGPATRSTLARRLHPDVRPWGFVLLLERPG
jgi:hypothetical protein